MNQRTLSTHRIVGRSMIGTVYLAVLVVFFGVQLVFIKLLPFPPPSVVALVAVTCCARILEIWFARNTLNASAFALPSIVWSLLLPLFLAILTGQPDTHYLGMSILPILEAAIYFSLTATLLVALSASAVSAFWVAFVANFHAPIQLGEIIESTTLILVYLAVGGLTWLLINILREREDELRQKLDDLRQTRTKLIEEEKLAAVGRLASAVAHEIRNPVAIIASALEASSSTFLSPAERDEMSKIASSESKRLESLTTDFLSYASPAKATLEKLDASLLVGYIVSIAQPQALAKNLDLTLHAEDSLHVYGNEGHLQQAILNVVRNAIEASPEGRAIGVSLNRAPEDCLSMKIENSGPAIPENVVSHIFEPFFTNKERGTGLGLAIAKKFVEGYDGRLFLERNDPDHIIFTILLPLSHEKLIAMPQSRSEVALG